MSLGLKLKSTISAREEERRRQTDESVRQWRGAIQEWLEGWQIRTELIISGGSVPQPIRIPSYVNDYGTGCIDDPNHPHYDLILPVWEWARNEGLELRIYSNHDGGGMESWWEISVTSVD